MVNLFDRHSPIRHRGLILVLLLCVGLPTLVVMPRPVDPQHLPLPTLDLARFDAEQLERSVMRAEEASFSYEVRVVGELFRRFGRAEAGGESADAARLAKELRSAATKVLETSPAVELARLKTLQTDLFLHNLGVRSDGSAISSELVELGGSLTLRLADWETARRRPLQDEALMGALFRVRWARVTRVTARELAVTSNDWRRYYRLQLEHPQLFAKRPEIQTQLQASAINGLAAVDLRYPARLARGILRYSQGRYGAALSEFRAHLGGSSGLYRLRAQNYAAAAAAKAVGGRVAPASR